MVLQQSCCAPPKHPPQTDPVLKSAREQQICGKWPLVKSRRWPFTAAQGEVALRYKRRRSDKNKILLSWWTRLRPRRPAVKPEVRVDGFIAGTLCVRSLCSFLFSWRSNRGTITARYWLWPPTSLMKDQTNNFSQWSNNKGRLKWSQWSAATGWAFKAGFRVQSGSEAAAMNYWLLATLFFSVNETKWTYYLINKARQICL